MMACEMDIWRAAALLLGVYGDEALHYATMRVDELAAEGKTYELGAWKCIVAKMIEVMETAPKGMVQ